MGKALAGKAIIALSVGLATVPLAAQQLSNSYTFIKAVKERDADKVTALVTAPGNTVVNSKEAGTGNSALHILAQARDATWLNFLSSRGGRADAQNASGDTPLAVAARLGWLEGAEILLARRASVDLANGRGETPLILAVQGRHLPLVRLLLSQGANPKRTDSVAGYSAIDYAKQDRRSAAILKLLEAPAQRAREVAGPKL